MSATLEVSNIAPTQWANSPFLLSPLILLLNSSSQPGPLLFPSSSSPTSALNTGHYTAYSKHPTTQEWSYYNDETVTKVRHG